METLISVEEASSRITSRIGPPVPELVPLDQALGRVLLNEVVAKESIPPFENSAMDGFAVRSGDLGPSGGVLRIVGEVRAGQWPEALTGAGTCMRIMTGAPIPPGVDAVVPVEWTETVVGGTVRINKGIPKGRHIRGAGKDMEEGESVLASGTRISSGAVAVLATLGFAAVQVGKRPRISVVSTGDELVPVNCKPAPGQIRNSNGPSLVSRAQEAGGELSTHLHAVDEIEAVRSAVEEALEADMLVFSGGVSVGDHDLVKDVLVEMGLELDFWKVKQRPGKPLAFGVLSGRPVFGLPGNPVSAAICFEQYVRPAIWKWQGMEHDSRTKMWAFLEEDFGKPAGLHVFARGILSSAAGRLVVRPAGGQGSNLSMSMVRANCVAHLPEDWEEAPKGSLVEVELM
ncbi:molybdopterin molybdotransferase MoeA [Rhodothermus sp. AH-315-K08]|nr:molybdopterin molybdotransferase MoeA [Rhodothermus sp. AH-315-K08]